MIVTIKNKTYDNMLDCVNGAFYNDGILFMFTRKSTDAFGLIPISRITSTSNVSVVINNTEYPTNKGYDLYKISTIINAYIDTYEAVPLNIVNPNTNTSISINFNRHLRFMTRDNCYFIYDDITSSIFAQLVEGHIVYFSKTEYVKMIDDISFNSIINNTHTLLSLLKL